MEQSTRVGREGIAHVVAIATVALWGVTFVNTKCLIHAGLPPLDIFVLRFALAYVAMSALTHRRLRADTWRDEGRFLALGLTGGSLYFLTENTAVGLTHVNNVSFIVCTAPVLTILLNRLVTPGARISGRLMLGSALALLGVALVVCNGHFLLKLSPRGDLLAFAAALCWAVYSLLIKGVSKRYSPLFVTRKVFAYGLLTALPLVAWEGWSVSWSQLAQPVVAGNLLFLGLMASFACFLAWSWVVKMLGALKTANYVYINPLTTLVASALVLDEPMTWLAIVGCALIAVAIAYVNSVIRD